ncbi:type I-E CRISPR-associated protein Cas6/Cse3/CasE [Endozoicomonas acroporae]|uniref:type I-E CRISPR-associated protein Cas6/Cse3/CasE n=1 Tax=Endozoicomonas acroporae TaxID=1701104 RepID=UPI000C791C7E|nr:type I-E CRISPR-associated protein Cas6/Cse3/CasE [Endozoicomonas acroporae]
MIYEFVVRSETPPYQVYKLHQEVIDVVCGGGLGLNKEAARPLWRSHPSVKSSSGGSLLLVRSSEPPLGEVSRVKEQAVRFEAGELRKFNCRLNLSSRVWVEQHGCLTKDLNKGLEQDREKCRKKVEKSLAPSEVEPWLRLLLNQNGMTLQNAAIVSQNRVQLKQRHFFINAADIVFVARVADPKLAEEAYCRGIGRKRAFGFGLLVEAE